MMNQGKYLLSAVALAGLAACGGGGSGDDGQITVNLAGTASKGLLQNALVEVFAVNGGVVGTTSVASVRTGNDGKYTITNLKGPKGATYVLKVSAVAAGDGETGTTHVDELQGAQSITNFSMRSVVTPTLSTATPLAVNITPFSEMVVAAAGKETGGLTDANLTQAKTTIKDLVKFDPMSTEVASKDGLTTESSDETKRQLLLLTAVSSLVKKQADAGTLGCEADTTALKCVVDKLSDAADAKTLALKIGSGESTTNLGQLLSQQVTSLVGESGSFNGDFSGAEIDELKKPLDCQDQACNPVAPLSDQIANAITNAKNIFTQLKTDVTSLISSDGVVESATGPANQQAFKFQQSFKDAKPVLDMAFKDVGLMIMGMDLYRNYKRTGEIGVQDMRDNLNTVNVWGPEYGGACGLYETTDVTTRVLNTETQTANYIGCSAKYLVREDRASPFSTEYTRQEWRHSFWITPDASGPGFSYSAKVNLVTFDCDATGNNTGCVRAPDEDLVTDDAGKAVAFTGKGSIVLNNAGQATAASLTGDLPPGFTGSDFFDVNVTPAIQADVAKYATELNVSLARDANGRVNQVTGSGSFDGLDANGARYAKLSVADVVVKGAESATTGDMVFDSAAGELTFETADAKLQGSMALSAPETDVSGHIAPTRMSFTGGLSTMADGVTTEFLSGRLDLSLGGWADFNINEALTTGNSYTVDVDFTGSLTAPERPKLELNLTTTGVADGSDTPMDSMTLRYRSIDQGVATQEITVTFADLKAETPTITMSELASGLRLTRTGSDADAQLLVGDSGEKVGTAKNGMLYFSDGSFMSMDFGL